MVARITQARLNPSGVQDGPRFLDEVYLPNSEAQEGFRGMFGFFNEEGLFIVAEVYDTVEQVRATETQGWYQEMVELFGPENVKGMVRRSFYEVAICKGLEPAGASRATTPDVVNQADA
jgi:hypothetical protein